MAAATVARIAKIGVRTIAVHASTTYTASTKVAAIRAILGSALHRAATRPALHRAIVRTALRTTVDAIVVVTTIRRTVVVTHSVRRTSRYAS